MKKLTIEEKQVKHEIRITKSIIVSAHSQKLPCAPYLKLNEWICVYVVDNGFRIPLTSISIKSEENAIKCCELHNKCLGFSKDQVNDIISRSMGLMK